MEVQFLVLCASVRRTPEGVYSADNIGAVKFFSPNDAFPLRLDSAFLMLLRREQREREEVATLRFNLIDSDGRSVGGNWFAEGKFPKDQKFFSLAGTIALEFPGIGEYRLDVTADEDKLSTMYHCSIEVVPEPRRVKPPERKVPLP